MRLLARLLGVEPEPSYEAEGRLTTIREMVSAMPTCKIPEAIYLSLMNMLITRPVGTDAVGPPDVRNRVADAYVHLRTAEQLLKEWREADREEWREADRDA